MSIEDMKDRVLSRLKDYSPSKKAFPKVGDWHGANAYGIYGENYKDLYMKGVHGDSASGRKASEYRTLAKIGGLAVCYGAMAKTLAGRLGVSQVDSELFYNNFFKSFPVFKAYMDSFIRMVRKTCQAKDLFGRIRYLPVLGKSETGNAEEDDKLRRQKWGSINVAYNAPVQGSGATMLKFILVQLGGYLEKGRMNRVHGNLMVNYCPYTRIVGLDVSKVTDEFKAFVDGLECGNIKVLLMDGGSPVEEYSRNVRLSVADMNRFGVEILW